MNFKFPNRIEPNFWESVVIKEEKEVLCNITVNYFWSSFVGVFLTFNNIKRFGIVVMKRKATTDKSMTAKKHHWSAGLLKSIEDPECKVREDDKIVVIKDKYPKAQFHYLILPKEDIPSIWHVKKDHQNLLMHMHNVACDLIKDQADHEFFMGYHAMPSMQRLHLHVISTDFNSPCLKTKYHWNSFTTPFFLHSQDICRQLRIDGEIKKISPQMCKDYLNTKLKCLKCSKELKNMPNLKRHLLTHKGKQ